MTPDDPGPQIDWDALVGPEWAAWYALTPQERWRESQKLWETYLAAGGPLDPEPDPQSPFFDPDHDACPVSQQFANAEVARAWAVAMRSRR